MSAILFLCFQNPPTINLPDQGVRLWKSRRPLEVWGSQSLPQPRGRQSVAGFEPPAALSLVTLFLTLHGYPGAMRSAVAPESGATMYHRLLFLSVLPAGRTAEHFNTRLSSLPSHFPWQPLTMGLWWSVDSEHLLIMAVYCYCLLLSEVRISNLPRTNHRRVFFFFNLPIVSR